jgi:glycerol transport system permease protein
VFALLPIYWMVNMSFKTNEEILASFSPLAAATSPGTTTSTIFTDESWYSGYINSLIYVAINTVISLTVALPAAYAFSRYSSWATSMLFFWLLTNRMTPPAVFLLPFFQLYTTLGLMDTHLAVALAHLLFNVPLAVWILEGFMSGIPREIDETAYIDGYSFPRFFLTIFIPLIKAGVGVAAFFCFMFSWVELLLARTLTSVNAKPIVATMTRTVSASGMDWAVLAAAGVLTIVPGAIVIWFVRHYIAKGFAMGGESVMFDWMVWTTPVAVFFSCIVLMLVGMTVWEIKSPTVMRKGFLPIATTRGDRLFIGLLLSAAYINLAFVGLSGKFTEWFALDSEPSIWISFVLSMALLALVMRRG